MPIPSRPELHFNSFDELLADLEKLHTSGWEKSGQWSLAQVCDHLARGMNCMLDGGMPYIPGPFRWIARAMVRRMVRKQKYPSLKVSAPKAMKPVPDITEAAAILDVQAAVARLQQLSGSTVYVHPFGVLSMHDFHQMVLLHAAHHLAYLRPQSGIMQAAQKAG